MIRETSARALDRVKIWRGASRIAAAAAVAAALVVELLRASLDDASRFAEGSSTEQWGRPDRVKASGLANAIARKVTGV